MMMIKNWIDLLHIPEFYKVADTLFNNVPIEDKERVMQFTENTKIIIQSPLGITSNYTRLMRVKESLGSLEMHVSPEILSMLPSHVWMRGAKRIERKDGSLYYGFGSIIFLWIKENRSELFTPRLDSNAIFNDFNFPAIVEAKHIGIHFDTSGKPYHGYHHDRSKDLTDSKKWKSVPALKASYLSAFWSNEEGRQIRANGPSSIGFRNYREFWVDGEFKRATWDGNGFNWPLGWMKAGTTEKELDLFIKQSKGIFPRENQFFKDERDEFNYITEYMIDG